MSAFDPGDFASLAMYPFGPLVEAWNRLYAAASRGVVGAPSGLRWDLEPHETWLNPRLSLGMTCGWPLVTALRDRVRPIGAFLHDTEGTASHLYRSVIVSNRPVELEDLWGSRAAINSADSLSGHISLLAAMPGEPAEWPGDIMWTGAHVVSIAAVRSHDADVASIDGLTWAYLRRDAPEMLADLAIIGGGPLVPHLPLIVSEHASDEVVAAWRSGFARAVHEPALADELGTLMIDGFIALNLADYDAALRPLVRTQPR